MDRFSPGPLHPVQDRHFLFRNGLAAFFLTAITLLIFAQSFHFGFIEFDDDLFVENNPPLQQGLSLEGIRWAFSANFLKTSPGAEYWEPLTLLTRLADYQFFGKDPGAFHRTSVLIHLAAGLALLGMLQTLTGRFWESLVVSALFLVHPMHVEAVCWLSARKDLVSGFFYILAIWAYAIYGKNPDRRRYGLLLFAFILANLAKPMAVSLPFIFGFLDFWPLQRWQNASKRARWNLFWEKIPFLLIATFVSVLAYITQKGLGALADDGLLPLPWRLGNAILSTGTYLAKAIIPTNLAILYPHPGKLLNLPLTVLSGVSVLILIVVAYRLRQRRPWLLVGLLWFLFVLGPVIGIIQIGDQAMADRYSYLSFIGLFIAVAWEFSDRMKNGSSDEFPAGKTAPTRPAWIAGLSVVGIFAFVSYLQTATWKNSISAFSHAIDVTDNNYVMHFNLGSELVKIGDRKSGFAHLQEAGRIRAPVISYNLKMSDEEVRAKNYASAAARIGHLLGLMPWNSDLHIKLGRIFLMNNQREQGERQFALAFHYHPELTLPRLELAKSRAASGHFAEAQSILDRALQIEPANADLLNFQKTLPAAPLSP